MSRFPFFAPAVFLLLTLGSARAEPPAGVKVEQTDDYVQIDTDALQARIRKKGYVSGVAAGTLPRQEDRGPRRSASACTSWTSSWPPAGPTTATRATPSCTAICPSITSKARKSARRPRS